MKLIFFYVLTATLMTFLVVGFVGFIKFIRKMFDNDRNY